MEIMLHITCADAARYAAPLSAALNRAGVPWGCFLTNDGVRVLSDPGFAASVAGAQKAAVCEHSWDQFMAGMNCPVERGSQTGNSLMMAEARRVVSL